ncbi:hypothetical protein HHK36_025465 [Tetracentron sinense]|uniref:RING-type E3 ubiquitin transferase n=1 Tax=Tetracentron sinense TaxID=13715 RepID=A0A834YLD5_TETSI|nr:hypothetical protein HHK36_025465 [Tetracentron sinense]
MSSTGGGSKSPETAVAVAVRGGKGCRSNGSRRAVRWAIENLLPHADRFILVHVMPPITSIPTPSGKRIPIKEMDADVVAMYMQDMALKAEEIFLPFKRLCKTRQMETLVLEDEKPATALLRYISESGTKSLVLGAFSSNCILRKLRGPGVPSTVLRSAPNTCDIYVVSRPKLIKKLANSPSTSVTRTGHWMFTRRKELREGSNSITVESKVNKTLEPSSEASLSYQISQEYTIENSSTIASLEDHQERSHQNLGNRNIEIQSVRECDFMDSADTKRSEVQAEVEQLRLELQTTVAMYSQACEDLVYTQNKVQLLSSECLEGERRVNIVREREETLRRIAAEEKAKHLEALKEVEMARKLLAEESYGRQIAELNALRESSDRQKIFDALFSSDKRYRRYTRDEIDVATGFFSKDNLIGEGGYGKVYKCSLDHTPVAVKVLRPDASDKKEEFLKEVEVLSQLRHPHMVLLLGACPESGCLVYEYMENGSLDEHIFCKNGNPPLPWFVRFRIAFEVACGLAFLHSSIPEPIVHRDLKPGNILLDRNYVSKIGDVGLAKLISDVVPDNISEYRDSVLAGTLYYMDPEYQRTGTLRPKSDLYAFGVITLQLLTARHPNGLIMTFENAINNGSLADILDKSVTDWPLAETEELAGIALKCSKLRCRERPDLESEVLPVLKKLSDIADASVKLQKSNIHAPSYYFCPILQEIMDDPHIAADGFTYEYRAIKAWIEKHNVSPVSRLRLQHTTLTPNHTLRSAIQEWKPRITFPSS